MSSIIGTRFTSARGDIAIWQPVSGVRRQPAQTYGWRHIQMGLRVNTNYNFKAFSYYSGDDTDAALPGQIATEAN